jgi:tetratricopeptide (TPR) repeat protein
MAMAERARNTKLAARAHADAGNTFFWERRWDEAADAFRRAGSLDVGWAVPPKLLGDALLASGTFEAALASYDRAAALDPFYVEPLLGRADVRLHQVRYPEAVEEFTSAGHQALRPGDVASAEYRIGDALFALGRSADAGVHYDRAVGLDPSGEESRLDWRAMAACRMPAAPTAVAASLPHGRVVDARPADGRLQPPA